MKITIDLGNVSFLRSALVNDIFRNNTVYLVADGNELIEMTVKDVHGPDDKYKGFTADDGCRYGLDGLYVLRAGNSLISENKRLSNIIRSAANMLDKR